MNENNTQNVIPNVDSKSKEERNVPALRFTNEKHLCKKVKQIASFGLGLTYTPNYVIEGIPFISSKNISQDFLDLNDINYISLDEYNRISNNCKPQKGDILFTRVGSNLGHPVIFETDEKLAIFVSLGYLRINNSINNEFVKHWMNSHSFWNQVKTKIAGSSKMNLNIGWLENFNIYLPSLDYQKKIASFLNLIEDRIKTQKKIIEDIELLKKQLRNNIFTDDYGNFLPLKKLYVKGKAGGTPKTTNREYYDGDIPFLSITDITNSGKYIDNCLKKISIKGLENSSAWIVPAGSLILSMYASVGLPCINKIELATSQAMFSMILKKGINIDYIYEYLNYFKENKLEAYLEKGTQSNINSNIVENILIPLPDEKTISKIVNILTSIDKKIDNEKSILQLYIKQKEYLLNKLFI